jgi:hypothetical protein
MKKEQLLLKKSKNILFIVASAVLIVFSLYFIFRGIHSDKYTMSMRGCHFKAHLTASVEMSTHPHDMSKVLSELPLDDCTGGYIMGVIEGYKKQNKNVKIDLQAAQSICREVKNSTKNEDSEEICMHTIGHLILVQKNGSVPEALAFCDTLNSDFKYECYSGVFMENLYHHNMQNNEMSFKTDDKIYAVQQKLCHDQVGVVAMACWRELSHMIVVRENSNIIKVDEECEKAQDTFSREACTVHAKGVMELTKLTETAK